MGEVVDLFRREQLPDMGGRHHDEVERVPGRFEEYSGRGSELATLPPRQLNSLRRDRKQGRIDSRGQTVARKEDRTERSERRVQKTLETLRQVMPFRRALAAS